MSHALIKTFSYDSVVSQLVHNITHNLNTQQVTYALFDSAGFEIREADIDTVQAITPNVLQVTLLGTAVLKARVQA